MNVIITNTSIDKVNNTTYSYNSVSVDNKEIDITVVTGSSNYVNLKVKNASQRVWRGMGKDFNSFEEALSNYKDPKIKAAIEAVKNN